MARRRRRSSVTANKTRSVKETCSLSTWAGEDGRCHWCDTELTGRQRSWCSPNCRRAFERNHVWSIAKTACKRRAKQACETCGSSDSLEVNHIVPVVGAGYSLACHHHQANLELLCHDCHVKVTNAQRAARKAA